MIGLVPKEKLEEFVKKSFRDLHLEDETGRTLPSIFIIGNPSEIQKM